MFMKQFYSLCTIKTNSLLLKKLLFLCLIMFALGPLLSLVQGQTVTTDKKDYRPGQTVIITGSGWLSGETVKLYIEKEPPVTSPITLYAVADVVGNIRNTEYITQAVDVGVKFTLTATGLTSGSTATAIFTDNTAANLDQVRNGAADDPTNPGDWVNGDAGQENSHFAEGMSIPYRVIMTDMCPGTQVTLTIEYDINRVTSMLLILLLIMTV